MTREKEKKPDLLGMVPEEIDSVLRARGLESYRSVQIVQWLYGQNARSFKEMSNLPEELREELNREYRITDLKPLKTLLSEIDGTSKTLFRLHDGATIETVLLPEGKRNTVCVSSQVGCAFECIFCASGQGGLSRNLAAGEIVDQVRHTHFNPKTGSVTNVVLMGMGEPLANYDAVSSAIRIFLHKRCLALGKRRITISTAGYVPGIRRLAQDDLPVRLALSLHATDNSTRTRLMPINKTFPIEQVLDACKALSRRRLPLTIEYLLIENMNDSLRQARELARICKSLKCKVNLIACNPGPSGKLAASSGERILQFQKELRKAGILAFIRPSRGLDIQGACGQLRSSSERSLRKSGKPTVTGDRES